MFVSEMSRQMKNECSEGKMITNYERVAMNIHAQWMIIYRVINV